jgi:hypothetical protein
MFIDISLSIGAFRAARMSSALADGYIPDGLTKAQYDKVVAADAAAAKKKASKFPKGKQVETLTEWMDKEAKKGITGKDLLTKGHRMVKAKYPEMYIDKNPQLTRD